MIFLAAGLAILALVLFVWSYALYPLWIRRRAARASVGGTVGPADAATASVEVLLAAADEESVIGDRVRNLLAQGGAPRISIGCDGCRDSTAERAREAGEGSDRVRVIEFPARRGKAAVVNDLVAESTADVLVFTDANTRFEPGAIAALVEACRAPGVGAACGRLVFERAAGGPGTPESDFWDRETALKEAEGRLGICLGGNGAIYAVRRELAARLPEDTTSMDDFLIPVRAARDGWRVVFAGEAVAREDAARDVAAEASRRFRIGIGAGQVLRRERWLLDVRAHPALTLAYLSRKAARWLAPLLAILAAAAALFAPESRAWGAGVLSVAALLAAGALLRPRLSGTWGRLYYFAVLNLVLALGVAAGLLGYSRPVWTRTARS
jgi:cellulose synthase/poly-beta-1,6-N-acetylglucosamine synthase-like glycosyltransferase